MQITSSLALLNPTLDDLIAMKIIHQLVDQTKDAFLEAHRQLERDEDQLRGSPQADKPYG
jgi:hypothetical protein